MMNHALPLRPLATFCVFLTLLFAPPVAAQQPADLADYSEVLPGEPSVIDGIWRIEATGDRILIENGHAFALDSWVHLMLWEVQPGMRTATDIRHTGIGTFSSYDDLLKRQIFYELREDGTIRAAGRGLLAPVFILIPVELIYPDFFAEEVAMLGQPEYVMPPAEAFSEDNGEVP